MQERDYIIGLRHIPGLGAKTISNLVRGFGSAKDLWQASRKELLGRTGQTEFFVDNFLKHRGAIHLEELLNGLALKQIKTVTILDQEYPANLKLIYDPPPVLFYQGQWQVNDTYAFGIVGSRKTTVYGQRVAEQFGRELASAGIVVVSGMARGVDTFAHRGCLEAAGRTIAVLGSGIDVIYPRENINLAHNIKEKGVLVTEFIPGTPPLAGNFPARNRIIAGLSLGILVVEAAAKSGALITADFALENGRDVFAIPGPISSLNSKGTNNLIKQGAKLIDQVGDILEELGLGTRALPETNGETLVNLSSDEQTLYDYLSWTPLRVEELVLQTKWVPSKVQTVLTLLELHGLIVQVPGRQFVRKSL